MSDQPSLPPPKPIPIKDRLSYLFLERGMLDVLDGAFVLVDQNGVRVHIPVGSVSCLFLEPGTRVTHEAVKLCARVGCLLLWTGEAGVRLYAAGQPGGARAERLLYQAKLALDEGLRLKVVRKMFELRFGEEPPERRSIDQLRGIEGVRVREIYASLARKYKLKWQGRDYDPKGKQSKDAVNVCVTAGNSCLYGLCEVAILAAGYAPAIGFLHYGKPRAFVYDMADLVKFETVVPLAFETAATTTASNLERAMRLKTRDQFRRSKLLRRLVPLIDEVLAAGGIEPPSEPEEGVGPAFADPEGTGDRGHRG